MMVITFQMSKQCTDALTEIYILVFILRSRSDSQEDTFVVEDGDILIGELINRSLNVCLLLLKVDNVF